MISKESRKTSSGRPRITQGTGKKIMDPQAIIIGQRTTSAHQEKTTMCPGTIVMGQGEILGALGRTNTKQKRTIVNQPKVTKVNEKINRDLERNMDQENNMDQERIIVDLERNHKDREGTVKGKERDNTKQ